MRYVVLKIDDNAAAEMLVKDMEKVETHGYPFVPQEASIVGLFAVPSLFCDDMAPGHRGKKTDSGWTRGKKYGWWVCGTCKRPRKAWATNLNALLSSARNLLNDGKDILGAATSASSVAASASSEGPTTADGTAIEPTGDGAANTVS